MFTMIIGEEGEYGCRLRKYLETHWTGSLRLHSFTRPETLRASEEKADCYLLDEHFFHCMQEELPPYIADRCILLTNEEREGSFCRYHPPEELIQMIEERQNGAAGDSRGGGINCTVTALYSPVFEPELDKIASAGMKQGDLYLGMEDVGSLTSGGGNMGDLCYFIGLKNREIADRVKETAREADGIWYVDSPDLSLDLLELTPEEYQWFFQCLKDSGEYGDIYVGLGSGIFTQISLNMLFDRFVLIDSRNNERQHACCGFLEQALQSESRRFQGVYERKYREDLLDAAVQ